MLTWTLVLGLFGITASTDLALQREVIQQRIDLVVRAYDSEVVDLPDPLASTAHIVPFHWRFADGETVRLRIHVTDSEVDAQRLLEQWRRTTNGSPDAHPKIGEGALLWKTPISCMLHFAQGNIVTRIIGSDPEVCSQVAERTAAEVAKLYAGE